MFFILSQCTLREIWLGCLQIMPNLGQSASSAANCQVTFVPCYKLEQSPMLRVPNLFRVWWVKCVKCNNIVPGQSQHFTLFSRWKLNHPTVQWSSIIIVTKKLWNVLIERAVQRTQTSDCSLGGWSKVLWDWMGPTGKMNWQTTLLVHPPLLYRMQIYLGSDQWVRM